MKKISILLLSLCLITLTTYGQYTSVTDKTNVPIAATSTVHTKTFTIPFTMYGLGSGLTPDSAMGSGAIMGLIRNTESDTIVPKELRFWTVAGIGSDTALVTTYVCDSLGSLTWAKHLTTNSIPIGKESGTQNLNCRYQGTVVTVFANTLVWTSPGYIAPGKLVVFKATFPSAIRKPTLLVGEMSVQYK